MLQSPHNNHLLRSYHTFLLSVDPPLSGMQTAAFAIFRIIRTSVESLGAKKGNEETIEESIDTFQ